MNRLRTDREDDHGEIEKAEVEIQIQEIQEGQTRRAGAQEEADGEEGEGQECGQEAGADGRQGRNNRRDAQATQGDENRTD